MGLESLHKVGYMSDAACTSPVVYVTTGAAAPTYATTYVTVAGGSTLSLSAVGAKLALATWYFKSGASCLAAGAPSPTFDIYAVSGGEIAPTSFVAFTVTTVTM